jgi:hypothetical protein
MADRKISYFRQLVDNTFYDEGPDGLENADRNFAVDIGVIGIISGLVATQHAPTADLTIDLTGPGTAYDQAGRRMFVPTATSGLDCSQDEDGNPTAVTTPGNERWCSVQLRFDRTLANPEVDGNGATVYTDQDESFELAVVRAGEFAIGTNTKPALPADGRLVVDFRLVNAQTQILNSDLDVTRRQDFQIFSGAQVPISSGGWSFLNPATDDVQATFDFIDARILYLDSSREMTENLVPNAAARDLGASGKEWDLFLEKLTPSGTATVDGNLIPETTGNDLGTASLRWSLFADLVNLDGQLVTSGSSRVNGHLLPLADGNDLGSAALKWDLWPKVVTTDATNTRVAGHWIPSATGNDLGSAALQWDLFSEVITSYHSTYTGALLFSSAKSVTREMDIAPLEQLSWATDTWLWVQATSWGARTITGWTYSASGATAGDIRLDFPDGVTVTDLLLTWYQQGGGVALSAEVFEIANNGSETSKGAKTIGGTGWQDKEAMGLVDFTVDRSNYKYVLRATGVASQDCALVSIVGTWTFTDLGRASI